MIKKLRNQPHAPKVGASSQMGAKRKKKKEEEYILLLCLYKIKYGFTIIV
jgi:hypothetical protein